MNLGVITNRTKNIGTVSINSDTAKVDMKDKKAKNNNTKIK